MLWSSRVRLLFLLPAVMWVLAFTLFPLGYSLYLAFFKVESKVEITREKVEVVDAQGDPVLLKSGKPKMKTIVTRNRTTLSEFVGLTNFKRMFNDPQVATAVKVTSIFVGVAVPLQLFLGFALAMLFNQKLAGRSVLRSVMILPIFATPIAVGYLFFTIFYEEGGPLGFLGIPFLSDPGWALFSVILVDVWQWTPFCFLVFLAALQGVSDELYEAALIDGASAWDMLIKVLLPILQPTILIVLLLRLAEALKLFDIPFALTGGGPGIATQSYSFLAFRTGPALLRSRLCERDGLRAAHRGHDHRDAVLQTAARNLWLSLGHRRRPEPARFDTRSSPCSASRSRSPSSFRCTGRSRRACATRSIPSPWPGSAFPGSTSSQRWHNWVDQLASPESRKALANSTIIAVWRSALAIVLGTPAAYALARFRFRLFKNKDITVWFLSQRVLPPVATVIPFYLVMRSLGLLDTQLALILINATFVLPFVVVILRQAFMELPGELEEAAFVDGATHLQVHAARGAADRGAVDRRHRAHHLRLLLERVPVRHHAREPRVDHGPGAHGRRRRHARRAVLVHGRARDGGHDSAGADRPARPALHRARPDAWRREGLGRRREV